MMKYFLPLAFVLMGFTAAAQDNDYFPGAPPLMDYVFKGWIIKEKGGRIAFRGIRFLDYGFLQVERRHEGANMILDTVHITSISKIKVKRKAFSRGMATGGGLGLIGGYYVGRETYESEYGIDEEEGPDPGAIGRGVVYAVGVAAPTSVIGGIFGGIFTPRNFRIDGQEDKLRFTLEKLQKKSDQTY